MGRACYSRYESKCLSSWQLPLIIHEVIRQHLPWRRQVAGLNVLSLVNSHAAAALQYGIDRSYDNRSENVVFYDVGSSSVEARRIHALVY